MLVGIAKLMERWKCGTWKNRDQDVALNLLKVVKPCQPVSDSGKLGFAVLWPLGRFSSGDHVV